MHAQYAAIGPETDAILAPRGCDRPPIIGTQRSLFTGEKDAHPSIQQWADPNISMLSLAVEGPRSLTYTLYTFPGELWTLEAARSRAFSR